MKCSYCGAEINEDEKFCGSCSAEILDVKNKLQESNAKVVHKKRNRIIALIVAITIVLTAIPTGWFLWNKSSNKDLSISPSDFSYIQIDEKFSDKKITDGESAIDSLNDVADMLGISDAKKEFVTKSEMEFDGNVYYRLAQLHKGITVYGRDVVVIADENSNAKGLTSNAMAISSNISLTATATQEQIYASVKEYTIKELGEPNATNIMVESIKADRLVIYNLSNDGTAHLAYELYVNFNNISKYGSYNFIVSAFSGEVLCATATIVQENATCYNSDGSQQFNGFYDENKLIYQMYEPFRKIKIYTYKGTDSGDENCTQDLISSTDKYFGNDANAESDHATALTYLTNMSSIYDYYKNTFKETAYGSLLAFFNDGRDKGKNAFGGNGTEDSTGDVVGYISMGSETGVESIDTMAHEYTHVVSRSRVKWIDEHRETGAINEGYSDIFGEIIEGDLTNSAPDWEHGRRLINDPTKNNYPDKINYNYNPDHMPEDYSHTYSTAVSYAAYLMWNGGSKKKSNEWTAIRDTEKLAKIWYGSLLTMHSDATFAQCRNAVELSARIMLTNGKLTNSEYETVVKAFEYVGIDNAAYQYKQLVKNEFDLSVLSSKKTNDLRFNLTILKLPTILSGPGIKNDDTKITKVMDKNFVTGSQKINLKENGTYQIIVKDSDDKNKSPINVRIIVNGENPNSTDKVEIHTDFSDVMVIILNDNSQPNSDSNQTTVPPASNTYSSFLSGNPFDKSSNLFSYNNEYNFTAFSTSEGVVLPRWPVELQNAFKNKLFDVSNGSAEIYSTTFEMTSSDPYTIIGYTISKYQSTGLFLFSNINRDYDVFCYLLKGDDQYYLVKETVMKEPIHKGNGTVPIGIADDNYKLVEAISLTGFDTKKTTVFEYIYDKKDNTLEYKYKEDGDESIDKTLYSNKWSGEYERENDAINFIKSILSKKGASNRVRGNGEFVSEITPLCALRTVMNPTVIAREKKDNAGNGKITVLSNKQVSSVAPSSSDSQKGGYAGNQTAEQLRKSIIGSWGSFGDYIFESNGVCYFMNDKKNPGTYTITNDKTLIVKFPWTNNNYTWTNESFSEFRKHSSGYFWCFTDDDILRLNGNDYYRDGQMILN